MHRRRFLGTFLQAAGLAVFPSVWRRRAMAAEELADGALVGPGEAGQYAVKAAMLAAEEANYIHLAILGKKSVTSAQVPDCAGE